MNRTNLIKILGIIGLVVFIFLAVGCSGTYKKDITQTVTSIDVAGKPVTVTTKTVSKMPKDIAFEEKLVEKQAACTSKDVVAEAVELSIKNINVMDLKSGAAQAEYIEAVSDGQLIQLAQTAINALKGDPQIACYNSIVKQATAYYRTEAKRSDNRWGFGKFVAGSAIVGYSVDSVMGATAAGIMTTNTNTNSRVVTNSSQSSSSGESVITGITATQGSAAADGNSVATQGGVDKNQNFPITGESNLDGSGNPSAPAINDQDNIQPKTSIGLVPVQ